MPDGSADDRLDLPIDEKTTITLKKPITVAGKLVDQLVLREPTTGELRAAGDGENATATVIILASRVCAVPEAAIEQMAASDYAKVQRFFMQFMRDDRLTGRP